MAVPTDQPPSRSGDSTPTSGGARLWRWLVAFWRELTTLGVLDSAAALTYYGMLSIAPALIVIVALLGLFGGGATDALLEQLAEYAPGAARSIVEGAVKDIAGTGTGPGVLLFIVGLVTATWSASGYLGAFGRVVGGMTSVADRRPWWQKLIWRFAVTSALLLLLVIITFMVVASGPVARQIADVVGVGDAFTTAWSFVKWPVVLVAMAVLLSLLLSTVHGPARERTRFLTVGSAVAIGLWALVSAAFSFYVSRFASYNRVYGSLASIVIFLVWLWLTNVSLLGGVVIDERRRRREATVVVG